MTTMTEPTVTIIDTVTVPESTLAAIRDAIQTLKSGDIVALAKRIHDEVAPIERGWRGTPDGLHDVIGERTGWTELYGLLSQAASALNYCLGDYPTADDMPDFLTEEEVEQIEAIELRRAVRHAQYEEPATV